MYGGKLSKAVRFKEKVDKSEAIWSTGSGHPLWTKRGVYTYSQTDFLLFATLWMILFNLLVSLKIVSGKGDGIPSSLLFVM